MTDAGKVAFGDNVFIAPSCGFHISGHPIDSKRRNQGLEYAYPLIIGNNAWFGSGIQVMPGIIVYVRKHILRNEIAKIIAEIEVGV